MAPKELGERWDPKTPRGRQSLEAMTGLVMSLEPGQIIAHDDPELLAIVDGYRPLSLSGLLRATMTDEQIKALEGQRRTGIDTPVTNAALGARMDRIITSMEANDLPIDIRRVLETL